MHTTITQLPSPKTLQLSRLAERFRNGDRRAYAALYARLHGAVFKAVMGIVRSEADAEDVVQWAFVQAWESRERLRSPSSVRAWIVRIARNRARNLFTVRKRYYHDPEALEALCDDADMHAELVRSREREALYEAIASLSPRQSDVVRLRVEQGMTFKQIGVELGCSCVSARV
ncbi:MAG: sigma-70 family RNA polymerase sigma factor, partial [Myxococcota bacterium]